MSIKNVERVSIKSWIYYGYVRGSMTEGLTVAQATKKFCNEFGYVDKREYTTLVRMYYHLHQCEI